MHDRYTNPLCTRYAGRTMQHIYSDDNKFSTWRRLWVALAESEQELGLPITDAQLEQLRAHITDIDYAYAAEREHEVRHDVMAHVLTYGACCPDAKPILHLGATSCYVGDNTDIILMREALEQIRSLLVNVIQALADFADQTVTLEERPIEVISAYAARVRERLEKPVHQAIESLLAEEENGLAPDARETLSALRAQAEEAHRQAEEKRKEEEAARRKAQAEAKRKREEEAAAKARAEEEARRQAEEAARQKQAEEKRQRAQQIQSLRDSAQRKQEEFERGKRRCEEEIARRTEQIAALDAERSKLGFLFHLKEKRQIDEKAAALNKEIRDIRAQIDADAEKAEKRIHKLQARADLLSAKTGDLVEFGIDGFDKKTPLVWRVLRRDGDIVELFSRDVICVGSGGDWDGEDLTKKEKDSLFRYKEPTGLWRTSRGFPEKSFSAAELAAVVPVERLAWKRIYDDKYRSQKVTRRFYCPTVEERKKYDPHFSAKPTANLMEEAKKELWEEGKTIRDTQAYFDRNWPSWQRDITAYWLNCEPIPGGFGRGAFLHSPERNGCALGTMLGIRPMVTVDLSKISATV